MFGTTEAQAAIPPYEERLKTLTPEKQHFLGEVEEIHELFGWSLERFQRGHDMISGAQELLKKMVLAEVLIGYTKIDHGFAELIEARFNTVQSKTFSQFVVDDTYLLKKMGLVQAVAKLPSDLVKIVHKVNSIRNVLAHSYHPETRKEAKEGKLLYQDVDIHTKHGLILYGRDTSWVDTCLFQILNGAVFTGKEKGPD